jgi:hypothetical protein
MMAILGEWRGNFRSTPSPATILHLLGFEHTKLTYRFQKPLAAASGVTLAITIRAFDRTRCW